VGLHIRRSAFQGRGVGGFWSQRTRREASLPNAVVEQVYLVEVERCAGCKLLHFLNGDSVRTEIARPHLLEKPQRRQHGRDFPRAELIELRLQSLRTSSDLSVSNPYIPLAPIDAYTILACGEPSAGRLSLGGEAATPAMLRLFSKFAHGLLLDGAPLTTGE